MMDKPLVTVIIPAYNHERYIENCLDSIINQTYDNIELIILNDGSLDNTNERIMEYEQKLKRRFKKYKYINKENEGVCRTLNIGLSISQGKYIIPFASDDVMYPERITKQINYMEKNSQYGMVYTDGYYVNSDSYLNVNGRFEKTLLFSERIDFEEGDLFFFMLKNVFFMPTPTVCIKRECYEKLGMYDENTLCEDFDMFIEISKHFQIGSIKEPLTLHRIHDDNAGRKRSVLEPSIKSMIEKYKKSDLLSENEKEFFLSSLGYLLDTLEKAIGVTNYDELAPIIKDKKIIAWGTGGAYKKFKGRYKTELEFFIDSDETKYGNLIDGKEVFGPSKLLDIDKDKYYILVLSSFYKDIYECLKEYGLSFLDNYY